jgi:hypothetical protein
MLKIAATVTTSAAAALFGLLGVGSHTHAVVAAPSTMNAVAPIVHVYNTCSAPAPTTAAGFTKLFLAAPPADVGISVKVGSKSVWLWGDDLKNGTRSSLTVQARGCLKTSGQLFPSDTGNQHTSWYWIRSGKALSTTTFSVTGRQFVTTGSGVWDWKETGYDRTLTFRISWDNTVIRTATGSLVKAPAMSQEYFLTCPTTVAPIAGQFCYSQHLHPEFKLSSGKTLRTTARNVDHWTGNVNDYRVIFDEK